MSVAGRRIAHLDMDAFYASVELLRYPDLRGLPVVIAGGRDAQPVTRPDGTREYRRLASYVGRGVITTATYEARKLGVFSAMGVMKAARLAPDAVLLPVDFPAYRQAKAAVEQVLHKQQDAWNHHDLEAFHRFDQRKIAAGHHGKGAAFKILRRDDAARLLLLPEIPPDGNQLDAQAPRRAAAGEENFPTLFEREQHRLLDLPGPARLDKLAILRDHIVIHLEQQSQGGGDVPLRDVAEIGGHGVGGFSDEGAKFELAAELEKFIRTFAGRRDF